MLVVSGLVSLDDMKGVLVFIIGGKHFCLPFNILFAVVNPRDIKPASFTVNTKENFIKYNGEIIPLINFHNAFGMNSISVTDKTHLIILEKEGRKLAFYSDSVEELISFDRYIKDSVKILQPVTDDPALCEILLEGKHFTMPDFDALRRYVR